MNIKQSHDVTKTRETILFHFLLFLIRWASMQYNRFLHQTVLQKRKAVETSDWWKYKAKTWEQYLTDCVVPMKQPIHTTSNNTDLSADHDHSTSTYTCKSLSVLSFNKLSIFPTTLCSSLCVSLVPFLSLSTNSLSFQTHYFSSSPSLKLWIFPSILSVPLSLFQQTHSFQTLS